VVPRFDDEESDSSSDEETTQPHKHSDASQASRIPTIKSTARRSARRDNNDDEGVDEGGRGPNAGGEMQWAGVQQIQQLTNANAGLIDQVDALKRQLKT
jgi:hypothetical protein